MKSIRIPTATKKTPFRLTVVNSNVSIKGFTFVTHDQYINIANTVHIVVETILVSRLTLGF